jgi:hypothetical protein
MTTPVPRLRLVSLVFCLMFGSIGSATWLIQSAAAAEAATPSRAREMPMSEKKRIMRERAEALSSFDSVNFASWTLEYANKAAEGLLAFQDGMWIKVGLKDIDWAGGQYPHVEWGQTLNRWPQIKALAAAYRKTHDERYARTARAYIEDYIRHDPGFDARRKNRGDTTLSVAIRIQRWEVALPAFFDSPSFDDAFIQNILDSIATQACDLSHHLTGTNFRISELDALVFTALRLPFLENSRELLDIGITGMRANLGAQFLPDGVHVERTPGYHGGVVETATKYWDLAKRFPEADAHVDQEILKRAITYSAQSQLSAFNDTGIVYRDPQQDDQRPELRWARTMRGLFPKDQRDAYPPLEQVFPDAGHVFARSAWKPGADYLAFDAGTWGTGHDHLSRLGFTFRAGGRVLVADPGCFSYNMSDPIAIYGRSTPAHSTLNLNGLSQSNIDARLMRAEFTPSTALISGRYQGGYWPGRYSWGFGGKYGQGVFGLHNRTLFWVKGEYLLALDTMNADNNATIHNVWQMGPMEGWEKDERKLSWWSKNKDENLFLQLIPFGGNVQMQTFEGSKDPLRGWVAKNQVEAIPAPQVEFRYPSHYSVGAATLLISYAGEQKPAYTAKRTGTGKGDETLYEIEISLPNGGADLIAWSASLTTALENMPSSLNTDATFVWLRSDTSGKPTKSFVLDGSFVDFKAKRICDAPKREARLFVPE